MNHRYKYSHEHLDFVKVKRNTWLKLGRYFLYFLGSIALAVGYYIVFTTFFNTPEERGLLRESKLLKEHYAALNEKFDQLEVVLNDIEQRDRQIYQTIFKADPLSVNVMQTSGMAHYSEIELLDNSDIVKMTNKHLQSLNERVKVKTNLLNIIFNQLTKEDADYLTIPAIQPIRNNDLSRTGASIGMRIHPFYKVPRLHTGIDFIAAAGEDVMATADGKVTMANRSFRDYGNQVVIDHGNGYTTVYAHLEDINVKVGQSVKRGQVIATVGNSGSSMAPHLHYEVLKDGEYKDPLNFFFIDVSPDNHYKMVQLASNSGQSLD